MEEKKPIQCKRVITSNNLIIAAADAALNAVQDTLGNLPDEDYFLYKRTARAALNAAKAALGEED